MTIEPNGVESGNRNVHPFDTDGPVRISLGVSCVPKMFLIPETEIVHALALPNLVSGSATDYVKSADYVLRSLPQSQLAGFMQEIVEAAAFACNTGALYVVRDLLENWEATAEIYAISGEAEKIVTYIEASESTREQRRTEGEWDWETERQAFLQTQN